MVDAIHDEPAHVVVVEHPPPGSPAERLVEIFGKALFVLVQMAVAVDGKVVLAFSRHYVSQPNNCEPPVNGRMWKGTAFGGANGWRDVPKIVDWYMEGKINIDDLITRTMELDNINAWQGDVRS